MGDELMEEQWTWIDPNLPKPKRMGRPRAGDRNTINGILFVMRTGCRWKDVPRKFGWGSTCWRRLKAWQEEGVWKRLWEQLMAQLDEQERIIWEQSYIDGTF